MGENKKGYMAITKEGYSVFDVRCFCCKEETKCKLVDDRLSCKKCNHTEHTDES